MIIRNQEGIHVRIFPSFLNLMGVREESPKWNSSKGRRRLWTLLTIDVYTILYIQTQHIGRHTFLLIWLFLWLGSVVDSCWFCHLRVHSSLINQDLTSYRATPPTQWCWPVSPSLSVSTCCGQMIQAGPVCIFSLHWIK